jgi:uncharacterized protein YfdQ (DUF2303 family)
MNINDENNVAAAIAAGMMIGEPKMVSDHMAVILKPQNTSVHEIDLSALEDKYAATPRRKKGTRTLASEASFIAYVNAHKTGATSIYADKDNTCFTAVLNDHAPEVREPAPSTSDQPQPEAVTGGDTGGTPTAAALREKLEDLGHMMGARLVGFGSSDRDPLAGHGDFTAVYPCPQSVEWKRWVGNSQHDKANKTGMDQATFMQFLEDNLPDVTKPASGQLLGAVQSFEAKKDVAFKSAQRLHDGSVVFNYSESIAEVPHEGKLSLPDQFTITIPVFDGGLKYELDARLRFRISGGKLTLWYELVAPHKVLEHAFNIALQAVKAGTQDVPVYSV